MPGRRAESLSLPTRRGRPRARGAPVWTTASLSDSDMYWLYLCHEAGEALPTCLPFAALDSDGTPHSHYLKGLGLLLRPRCEAL